MEFVSDDYFDVHQDESLDISSVEPTPYDQFFIKFEVEFLREQQQEEDDDEHDVFRLESTIKTEIFLERCDRLPHNNLPWHNVTRMLHIMGVEGDRQPMMLRQICSFADKIANEPYNRNKKILPMKVYISIPVSDFIEESSEAVGLDGNEDLEKVKLGSECVCVICTERWRWEVKQQKCLALMCSMEIV
ncbi:E3 ubiquitin-protein ligase CIP8 [Capsicum chacoense]